MRSLPASILCALAALLLLAATPALAAPDVSGSSDLAAAGFPGVCDEPCFTVTKSFEVYLDGNATVPAGPNCPVGDNTYIYQITHTGGTGPFVPSLSKFETGVETDDVSAAGEIPGFGISPSSTVINSGADVIEWSFTSPLIGSGQSSTKLFLCSPLLPGAVTDTMVSVDGQLALEATGTCVGPVFQPAGEPLPCTIGFWKNRYDGKKGTLQWFPDGEFDTVVTAAVALSGGVFANEADLLAALSSQGNRTDEERARQQLAATLLNLAAGQEFSDNSKCKLFGGNSIDSNSCGTNISVDDAMAFIFDQLALGNYEAAKNCADDLNNGIGVVGAGSGQ